jgi:AcrR family transcriptional regulator
MQKIDRRIERTDQLLKDALVALILEKGYEAVTIKDITERANVAYVTFFRHYKEKEELLVSMLEKVVETLAATIDENGLENSLEKDCLIFEHAQQNSRLYRILLSSPGAMPIVRRVKAAIAARVLQKCRALFEGETTIPPEIFAFHMASSLLSVMQWWLENEMPYPPERMAEIYHQLVVESAWSEMRGVPRAS